MVKGCDGGLLGFLCGFVIALILIVGIGIIDDISGFCTLYGKIRRVIRYAGNQDTGLKEIPYTCNIGIAF